MNNHKTLCQNTGIFFSIFHEFAKVEQKVIMMNQKNATDVIHYVLILLQAINFFLNIFLHEYFFIAPWKICKRKL